MSKSIAVFGAGPGLGQAVARRYAQDGYQVVLVARRREPLESFAEELAGTGASAHVITADLADTDAVPALAERIRAAVGGLDALYYAPTPETASSPRRISPRSAPRRSCRSSSTRWSPSCRSSCLACSPTATAPS